MEHGNSSEVLSGSGGSEIVQGLQSFKRNMFLGYVLILLSGITGTVYLSIARHGAYGILAFLQGPVVLGSRISGSFSSYATEGLLISTLFLLALSFFFLLPRDPSKRTGFRYLNQYRFLLAILVVAYAETLVVLISTIFLSQTAISNKSLVFGSGSTFEDILYVLAIIFLLSFGLFSVAGSTMGIWGSVSFAFHVTRRYEFPALWFFLFAGVFYFPFAIPAGILGIYTVKSRTSIFVTAGKLLYQYSNVIVSRFVSSRSVKWATLIAASTAAALLLVVASMAVPVYLDGTVIFYQSRYMNGFTGTLIALGLSVSAMISSFSLIAMGRNREKVVSFILAALFWGILILIPGLNLIYLRNSNFAEMSRVMIINSGLIYADIGVFPSLIALFLQSARKRVRTSRPA